MDDKWTCFGSAGPLTHHLWQDGERFLDDDHRAGQPVQSNRKGHRAFNKDSHNAQMSVHSHMGFDT
eukprot:1740431-Amphidinium_carterae.1